MIDRHKPSMISNSGPLMSAFQCGRVEFLQRYIETLYIPHSVQAEIEQHGFAPQVQVLIEQNWIIPVELTEEETDRARALARRIATSPLTNDKSPAHHQPEAEAIVLAERLELGASRVLVEELAARQVLTAGGRQ